MSRAIIPEDLKMFLLSLYGFLKVFYRYCLIMIHMIWNIYKWEMQRITSNWKRSAAVLLLPAALMMVALNIFPMLINYLSTGTFGKSVVYIVEVVADGV